MKISLCTLFVCVLQMTAVNAEAQNTVVNLQASELSVGQLIAAIEDQTDLLILYRDRDINTDHRFHVQKKSDKVNSLLASAFANTDIRYEIENKYILLTRKGSPASERTILQQDGKRITGTVTDNSGEPVIGANIVEKGTSNGVITDMDGKFSLNISERAILQISYVGYINQEIAVGSQTALQVTLIESALGLDEVVVVGYGTQKKVNLTGAVAQVKGEILENRSVVNLSQALQGQVANLNISSTNGGAPGSTQSINIRGYTGFNTDGSTKSQSPLIVIDGIQGGNINTINMSDVENISVLKDAASAAIYGSSAPYGVIIINTKKGRNAQKPTITYGNNLMFTQPINLPTMMNSYDFANIFNEALLNANANPQFSGETLQRIKDYIDGKITDETTKDPTSDNWNSWGSANANNDWFDIYFKKFSFSQQHNVGVSGGTNHSNYYVGLGYNRQGGLFNYGDDSYNRFNVRTNLTTDLTKWLTFGFRGAFSRGLTDTPYGKANQDGDNFMNMASRLWPTNPLYNPDGHISEASQIEKLRLGGRDKTTLDNAILTGEFVVHPLTGWDITANYTFDGTYRNYSSHLKTIYHARPSGIVLPIGGPNSLSRDLQKNQHTTINLFSSYEKQLSSHYFRALVGYTQELYDNQTVTGSNNYLYSDDLPMLALMYGTNPSISDGASQLAIRGGFGRINYNYKEKYLIEFNGRYDGTSRFLKEVRFKFYPGVSAAWVPSKESFWEPLTDVVNTFKIRVTYGELGDQGFTDNYYPFYPSLGATRPTGGNYLFSGGREAYISQPSLVNPSLTWVTTATTNMGVDLAFLSNRLHLSFDWYQRNADDFAGPSQALPAILGTSAPQTNNSAMVTKGIELTAGWKHQIGGLAYEINAVLSDYRSKITRYPNPTGLNTTWYVGKELGEIWGYETVGLFQSEAEVAQAANQSKINSNPWTPGDVHYADLNGDGVIDWGNNTLENPGDRKVIGNSTPRFSYGLNLNASYKGFDFSVFLQGVGKRDVWLSDRANYFWGIDSRGNLWQSSLFTVHYDRWTETNRGGYYPKYYMSSQMGKNTQAQSRYLQNAAYLRVKNLQLGYSLPIWLVNKINSQKVRIFVSAENLATITKLVKTMDPEFVLSRGQWDVGDGKVYPLQRTWACGINITF